MATQRLMNSTALRRQHLLVEFSGLKNACPQGIFMSLTPGDPTLWIGVMFIRQGPYAPTILRFQISFPPAYPSLPPLVTFSTDIFHPLLTPRSTYMFTTDIQDSGTVSATDEERLPPGGFSLRHGFPDWFGRASRTVANAVENKSASVGGSTQHLQTPGKSLSPGASTSGRDTPESTSAEPSRIAVERLETVTTYDVLKYIRSTFDDAEVLDSVPIEAAGNPGAWHAWRTHRAKIARAAARKSAMEAEVGAWHEGLSDDESSKGKVRSLPSPSTPVQARAPGEWNWDGVWEVRSRKGIEGSLAEPILYGNAVISDDIIRFLQVEEPELEAMKERMMKSLEIG